MDCQEMDEYAERLKNNDFDGAIAFLRRKKKPTEEIATDSSSS